MESGEAEARSELADVREMPDTPARARRMQAVYKAIDNLQAHEPQTVNTTLPDLQQQLVQLTASDFASSTAIAGVVMAPLQQEVVQPTDENDDLEGDEDEDDEDDADGDQDDEDQNDGQGGGGQGPLQGVAPAQAGAQGKKKSKGQKGQKKCCAEEKH